MIDQERLKILVDGAKFDVSCSSSGSKRQNTLNGIGNAEFGGICHSFTSDGRCISLLKILMSNDCAYDCAYCINRKSNDVARATATPDEICELVMSFYKRNYIEGLFLSSAIVKNPDYTMEKLLEIVIKLRKMYAFNGYIHLKGIPNADRKLIDQACYYVDRMSFNIELPSEKSLKLLAPQKIKNAILTPMQRLTEEKKYQKQNKKNKFLPAGQTTQMIVGASPETDGHILKLTEALYRKYQLKRVYYSSFIPVNANVPILPNKPAGLLREHRLYQADWLIRYYGFNATEIVNDEDNLEEGYDPKCAWALRNMNLFPVEVNSCDLEMLLRVPGIGLRSAYKIINARKYKKLDFDDLKRMRVVLKRAVHFIVCNGKFSGGEKIDTIKTMLLLEENSANNAPIQLSMFSTPKINESVLTGEF